MATIDATQLPTIENFVRMQDPNDRIAAFIVDSLKQRNPILEDMTWMQGNMPTGHMTTTVSGYPDSMWRMYNQRVPVDHGETVQIMDTCGMMEGYSEVDVALANLNGNSNAWRMRQDMMRVNSMMNQMAKTLFHGSEVSNPASFNGLASRFSTLTGAKNSKNIIDAGGTGSDNTSIWLCCWGENTMTGIVPAASPTGWIINNKGQVTLDDNTGRMEIYRTHYRWDAGLSVMDWRYIVRICNIDRSVIQTLGTAYTSPNLIDMLIEASHLMEGTDAGRCAIYANREVITFLELQMNDRLKNSTLNYQQLANGNVMMTFKGIPIRRCDALEVDEARIT